MRLVLWHWSRELVGRVCRREHRFGLRVFEVTVCHCGHQLTMFRVLCLVEEWPQVGEGGFSRASKSMLVNIRKFSGITRTSEDKKPPKRFSCYGQAGERYLVL